MKHKKTKLWVIVVIIITVIMAIVSMILNSNDDKTDLEDILKLEIDEQLLEVTQEEIMEDFFLLSSSNTNWEEIIEFIDEKILLVSNENASLMVLKLLEVQENYLQDLDEKLYDIFDDEAMSDELYQLSSVEYNLNEVTVSEELKNLLTEIEETGYKLGMSEGYYFLVTDYSFFQEYSIYATSDVKSYIDIMTTESNKLATSDAGLMIGWDELVSRALNLEKFINKYPNFSLIDNVNKHYEFYIRISLFGIDNTPHFSYETDLMHEDLKSIYMETVKNNEDSEYAQMISEYLYVLEKNGYKLTDEVDEFRQIKYDSMVN